MWTTAFEFAGKKLRNPPAMVIVPVGKHGKVDGVDINAQSGGLVHEMS